MFAVGSSIRCDLKRFAGDLVLTNTLAGVAATDAKQFLDDGLVANANLRLGVLRENLLDQAKQLLQLLEYVDRNVPADVGRKPTS